MVSNCNPLIFIFKQVHHHSWFGGKTWGIRLYVSGYDPRTSFHIYGEQARSHPTGPATGALVPPTAPTKKPPEPTTATSLAIAPTTNLSTLLLQPYQPVSDLYGPLDIMFQYLNRSNPNLTQDCWLCLDPQPPFYIGLAQTTSIGSNTSFQTKNSSSNTSFQTKNVISSKT